MIKFYQFRKWYRFSGIYLIGALSAPLLDPVIAATAVLQLFLVQMHSFSMNNYYDYKFWNENNYLKEVSAEHSKIVIHAAMLIPLLLAVSLFPITGYATVLLLVYAATFYLYQGPPRLKNYWVSNILINAFCMGFLIYAYPFLAQTVTITPMFVFFSILFFCYIAFYEIAHQYEHHREEDNFSIMEGIGLKNSLIVASTLIFVVPFISGLILFYNGLNLSIFSLYLVFSLLKLYRFKTIFEEPEKFIFVRESWHKFYTTFEGTAYIILLIILI